MKSVVALVLLVVVEGCVVCMVVGGVDFCFIGVAITYNSFGHL